jgi:O-antigen ligase
MMLVSAPPVSNNGPLFYLTAFLIFIHFGRLFDSPSLIGLKIPLIVGVISFLTVLMGGLKFLRTKVGFAYLAVVAWMCAAAPFSSWRGGSVLYALGYVQNFLPLMILVAMATKTAKDLMKLSAVLALSILFHVVMDGTEVGGRFALNGTYGNADDVALLGGFLIPFLILLGTRLRNPIIRNLFIVSTSGCLLVMTGRTGTRAAIPALLCLAAVYFIRGQGVQKMIILILVLVVPLFASAFLSGDTLKRLGTVLEAFHPKDRYDGTEAMASSLQRHELMRDGIQATLHHPIFGVGPGMFMQWRFDNMPRADGQHKAYMPAHNTYVEFMSENGFPGVILYVIFLYVMLSQVRAMRKLTLGQTTEQANLVRSIALAVEASLVYFAVCAIFMTCDKHPHQFVIAGFVMAMEMRARSWLATEAPAAAPLPAQFMALPVIGKRSFPVAVR